MFLYYSGCKNLSKIIAKLEKCKIPTGIITGKYKKGHIIKQYLGPKKAKFYLNPYELNLQIYGETKDGKLVRGDYLVKYDIDAQTYIRSLNELEENTEELESKLSKEFSYDLSGKIYEFSSRNIKNEDTKRYFESEIEKRAKITFHKKGILPYKITSQWEVVSNYPIIKNMLENLISKIDKKAGEQDINEFIKNESKHLGEELCSFANFTGKMRAYAAQRLFELVGIRSILEPDKKPSDYIKSNDVNNIINEAFGKGLELFVNFNV